MTQATGTTVLRSTAVTFRSGVGVASEIISLAAPTQGEVSVEIRATGVCHSDLHLVNGDWPVDKPIVLGHEASGVVTSVGDGVTGIQPGDHVVLSWFAPCGRCENCAAGKAWLCSGTTALNHTLPDGSSPFSDVEGAPVWPYLGLGTFTQFVTVPESAVVKVSKDLPFDIGALLGCSVTTGMGAVINTAQVRPGNSAAVIGCGGVGLSAIMGLKISGADPIIAVDVSAEKLAIAAELGATVLLRADEVDVPAYLTEEFGGLDFVFEAIGRPATIETLPQMLKAGGVAVLVGMTRMDAQITLNPFDLADRGISIVGCNYGSSVGAVDVPRLARLFLSGNLPLEKIVGKTRPLSEYAEALDDLASGTGLRTILIP